MYQYQSNDDTITAIATPIGAGGIGIVRLSGPQAFTIADHAARLKCGLAPSVMKGFSVALGFVIDGDGQHIDEALITVMRAPKSYTGQDVVEISVHGGLVSVQQTLKILVKLGARVAEPGEFTKRAFLNGRIDLTQAEAVLDIIHAKTSDFARVSQNQLGGELSKSLNSIRESLMSVYTHIEAAINFPEDDISPDGRVQIHAQVTQAKARIDDLLRTSTHGRLLKEGIRIVLCGKPNAGKSSLLNALIKEDRAIVTDIAGTTRDILEESVQIKGIPLTFVDTAGILDPRDRIEEEAIKRSHLSIDSADLVMLILDGSRQLEEADQQLMARLQGRKMLVVINKQDLPQVLDLSSIPQEALTVKISCLQRIGIEALQSAILRSVDQGIEGSIGSVIVTNARHIHALEQSKELLMEAMVLMEAQEAWEIIAQDIKDAVNACDAITGRNIDGDLIDQIFAAFCIGK